jgi:hypothetical protein
MTRRDRYGEPIEDEGDLDLVERPGRRAFREELARMRAGATAKATATRTSGTSVPGPS